MRPDVRLPQLGSSPLSGRVVGQTLAHTRTIILTHGRERSPSGTHADARGYELYLRCLIRQSFTAPDPPQITPHTRPTPQGTLGLRLPPGGERLVFRTGRNADVTNPVLPTPCLIPAAGMRMLSFHSANRVWLALGHRKALSRPDGDLGWFGDDYSSIRHAAMGLAPSALRHSSVTTSDRG